MVGVVFGVGYVRSYFTTESNHFGHKEVVCVRRHYTRVARFGKPSKAVSCRIVSCAVCNVGRSVVVLY